ncbi:MAG: TIGR04211 family SH3 domain-containing protein [Proteobacteria bacterium]|nr:TIGR04211 family SH3 domain-containing protein [Pseudomonadota bacterium]MCH8930909.1 TIGR04211 family SH3 domain-containing protein [Pseudomonadota bacterium]
MMKAGGFLVAASLLWMMAFPAQAEYVTDELQLGLHIAEDTSDTPFRTLVSGTELEILERNRFYARVRTSAGEEGWVKVGYLITRKPAAARAMELEAANAKINDRLEKVLAQTSDVRQTIAGLESELATAKTEGAAALARATELEVDNTRFNERMIDFRGSVPVRWAFLAAGLMLLVGFFSGFLWFDYRSRKRYGGFRVY